MHNATTKQRLSAFRRRFGIWTSLPRWARERRARAEAPAPAADPLADTVALTDPAAALPPPVPVMQPTPPLSDLAGEPRALEPAALRRRRRGITAGVLAGIVLVLLAVLALVPWLRARAPAEAAMPAASSIPTATETPAAAPAAIPAPTPTATPSAAATLVEVRPGDTLWDLAAAHLGDPMKWPLLHDANRGTVRNPDLIYPGQALRIPAG